MNETIICGIKVKHIFEGSNFKYGYYAFISTDGQFVIGEERGREGGILYRGEYTGISTSHMHDIYKENTRLFNDIVRYFRDHKNDTQNAVMCSNMTDMEKLSEIFNIDKEEVKEQFPQLYYAILAVLDKEKKPDPSGYFNM